MLWLPQETIVFDGANLARSFSAELAEEGRKAAAAGGAFNDHVINGRYWSRHLLSGQETGLEPGDRFEELTAYVLFHSSKADPIGDFFEWEKKIRAAK